jgi:hypothetical protein
MGISTYACTINVASNTSYVDVSTIALVPGNLKVTFFGLKLDATNNYGAQWDARICTSNNCAANTVVDDYSGVPAYTEF